MPKSVPAEGPGRGGRPAGPRCVAIVGPFQSGKTTLLEAILARCGAVSRAGRVADQTSVGDASEEARAHGMSVEPNVASCVFMGESFTFIDCPGSVEFAHDARAALAGCDAAVVVCEADERKAPALGLILRELEEADVPRFLFLNKIDTATRRVRDTLRLLQPASRTPLLLRQIPIWRDGIAIGYIDLALERAFVYREHAPSQVVELPPDEIGREKEARFSMLERLADHDDALMEELISEIEPPRDQVFDDLARDLREGHVAPVFFGSAERGGGVTRLLKALRHEAPGVAATRVRLGVSAEGPPLAQALRTRHAGHGGKLTLARVLRGGFAEGDVISASSGREGRLAGLARLMGETQIRIPRAGEGETVAFLRLDAAATGDALTSAPERPAAIASVAPPEPVHALAISARDSRDDARLATALARLTEEDPALIVERRPDLGETRLCGQGEMHLRVALERLARRFGVATSTGRPGVGYRETIRDAVSARGRHRKQTGGHGQFGDVVLTLSPLPRGEGVVFEDRIAGGAVPRQYIPSVEIGVREFAARGPLGFPMVDLKATLTDGSHHSVDSSDMAFRAAARLAMAEAAARARPVLLEPILSVAIHAPTEAMSRAAGLVSARRGQILGFNARPGWAGWETLQAQIPEAEMGGLIVELRSVSAGVGGYVAQFDHLAEVAGRAAEAALALHGAGR